MLWLGYRVVFPEDSSMGHRVILLEDRSMTNSQYSHRRVDCVLYYRYILTNDQIDHYVVHLGGLTMDLTAGFLLYLDDTRWLGTAMVTSFHLMNSRMFSIGRFFCLEYQNH